MPADHLRTTLSPREAARLTGAGRSSIMRAITAGNLPAQRDNRNQWQIEREALDRWNAARADHDRTMSAGQSGPVRTTSADHPETALELAAARATIAQLEVRLEERAALVRAAESRAQAAEALAAKLTDILAARGLPAPAVVPTVPKRRRWWSWRS